MDTPPPRSLGPRRSHRAGEEPERDSSPRGLARLALASGNGKDVAELTAAQGRSRLALGPGALRGIIALVAVLALCAWAWAAVRPTPSAYAKDTLRDESSAQEPEGSGGGTDASGGSAGGTSPTTGEPKQVSEGVPPGQAAGDEEVVVAYVSGAVNAPGVYTLPAPARVIDLVDAASGLTDSADPSAINLAAMVPDGAHVHVPAVGEPPSASGGGIVGGEVSSAPRRINVNTAGLDELQEIPGVGPVTAQAIIDWRTENGAFETVEDLLSVSGIGKATLEKMRGVVSVQ